MPLRRPPALLIVLLLGAGAIASPASAQSTNAEIFADLALSCLAEAPDTLTSFSLDAPEGYPYMRTALVREWTASGRGIYLPDTTAAPAARAALAYDVERAAVRYERAGRGHVERSIDLALRYRVTAADGRLLQESSCTRDYQDRVPRRAIAALSSPAFPETQAPLPPGGTFRRYIEPALLTAATALGVYLFFVLRSETPETP